MKLHQTLIAAALLALCNTAANAGTQVPLLKSSPIWGGPTQDHVDVTLMYTGYDNLGAPLVLDLNTGSKFVEAVVQTLKPNGVRFNRAVQVVYCGGALPNNQYILNPGQTCWIRAKVDKVGPTIATFALPQNTPDILDTLRASIEVKDINEKELARAELR